MVWIILAGLVALAVGAAIVLILSGGQTLPAQSRPVPSRVEKLVGQRGQVTQAIDVVLGQGRVTVAGEDWAAQSASPIAQGTEVVVEGFDGIVLQVSTRRATA